LIPADGIGREGKKNIFWFWKEKKRNQGSTFY
jgi:hypothetical protein